MFRPRLYGDSVFEGYERPTAVHAERQILVLRCQSRADGSKLGDARLPFLLTTDEPFPPFLVEQLGPRSPRTVLDVGSSFQNGLATFLGADAVRRTCPAKPFLFVRRSPASLAAQDQRLHRLCIQQGSLHQQLYFSMRSASSCASLSSCSSEKTTTRLDAKETTNADSGTMLYLYVIYKFSYK